jgi:hypothetical protein
MNRRRILVAPAMILALALIASCGVDLPAPPAAQVQPTIQTMAPMAPTPGSDLPAGQSTSAPPTTAAPVEPTATYSPEIVATKPEDIAGVWLVKRFVALLSNVVYAADLTFRADGTVSFDDIDSGTHIFSGILRFADGQVTIESEECWDAATGVFYQCSMSFINYSESQSGIPVRIRFESVGGKGVFIDNLDGKALLLDKR